MKRVRTDQCTARQHVRAALAKILALALFFALAPHAALGQQHKRKKTPSHPASQKPPSTTTSGAQTPEGQLEALARALREDGSAAEYARLSDFANRHSTSELGERAALALGYTDYSNARFTQAETWFERAAGQWPKGAPHPTPLLAEYALYWKAFTDRALGRNLDALAELEQFSRSYPDSVMTEPALQTLADAALALNQPGRAVAALDAYGKTESRPILLLRRAQAKEKYASGDSDTTAPLLAAASDYQAVFYRFPLSDEARAAGERLVQLQRALNTMYPVTPLDQQLARADALADAHRWCEAQADYQLLLPQLRDAKLDSAASHAELRIAVARVELGAPTGVLADLETPLPEVDAERLYQLAQAYRARRQDDEMLATVDHLAALYPQSHWTEEGLFAAGNAQWVKLDRQHAAAYYARVAHQFPADKNADVAQWRVAWTAYLDHNPDAVTLLEDHVRHYPVSTYTPDALYWLGRTAERDGNSAHARSFYVKLRDRFPETYFGLRAADRLKPPPDGLGPESLNTADFLGQIPDPPPLPALDAPIPEAGAGRWTREHALRTIAFDASAEQELREAFAETGTPRLLWEVAKSAIAAGRYAVGITTARVALPQLEARKLDELPPDIWKTVFPLPYEANLRSAAARNNVDPMFVAAVIRQESVFQPDALSRAGAVGLMQVLPKTGKGLARRLKLPYSRARLFRPEYNLLLGSLYLSDLRAQFSTPEAVLAAFNAGEDRVVAWQAERTFDDPSEFVESIPFTETREYVQIVMRNAELYRHLYSSSRVARAAP